MHKRLRDYRKQPEVIMRTRLHRLALFISALTACASADRADDDSTGGKHDDPAESDAGVPVVSQGQISVIESVNDPFIGTATLAHAIFATQSLVGPPQDVGNCSILEPPGREPPPPLSRFSAGRIEVTGTVNPLTLAPMGTAPNVNYVPTIRPDEDVFEAGVRLAIRATGDDVPAFYGDVLAPDPIEGVELPTTISRSAGVTVSWTPTTSDGIYVSVFSHAIRLQALICRVSDTGSFTLTPETLALLAADVGQVKLAINRFNESFVKPSADWKVSLLAGTTVGTGLATIPLTP
jgi:hypothetical protein